MSRVRKRIVLSLVAALILFSLNAQESVFIGDGDIGSIRLFDSQGTSLAVTDEVTSDIGEGWIIYNQDSPILIITPKGSISLYEDSILITGNLMSYDPSLYLVKGKATFTTENMQGGSLTVSTPVSLFTLSGDGEMFVISSDNEESVTSFKGEVTSYNALTGATKVVDDFQKLGMQDSRNKPKQVAPGYYLTYASYPNIMLAKQLISDLATAHMEFPPSPTFLGVQKQAFVPASPSLQQDVVIVPVLTPSFTHVERDSASAPSVPYRLSVRKEAIPLPDTPRSLRSISTPVPLSRITITVQPAIPELPAFTAIHSVQEVKPVPSPPSLSSFTTREVLPEIEVSTQPLVIEAAPPASSVTTKTTTVQDKPQSILFSQDHSVKEGAFGAELTYAFELDGTDNNALMHTLSLKPYVSYKAFALTMQVSAQTPDYATFDSPVIHIPTDKLGLVSYGLGYISSLRIGYTTSPFFLALDNKHYDAPLTGHLLASPFGERESLSLYNRIEFGAFSTTLHFDDLRFTNQLATPALPQYGSFFFGYEKQEGYRFSFALGTLFKLQQNPTQKMDLYPSVNVLFPLIDSRSTRLSLLLSATGYLPAVPEFDFDQFIDLDLANFFPNYLLSAGLNFQQGSFNAKVLASLREGENRNLLNSNLDLVANSNFDLYAETGLKGKNLSLNLAVQLPFKEDFSFAETTTAVQADFTQFTLSYMQKSFSISLGLQQTGLWQTLGFIRDGNKDMFFLFGSEHASSFIAATYSLGDLTFKVKGAYPLKATAATMPVVTISASYRLGIQF